MFYTEMESPLDTLLLLGDGEAITGLHMRDQKYPPSLGSDWRRDDLLFREARAQLQAYFAGELQDFDLPLRPQGTDFQQRVWQALGNIPYGSTASYQELAREIQSPRAVRAVGAANGRNPIAIVLPCHRVVGANGSLTGYAGGLARKQWLLAHEARHGPRVDLLSAS